MGRFRCLKHNYTFVAMRTLQLLGALSDREIQLLDKQIKTQKRKSLQLIYALLKKYRNSKGMPTNEELYHHAFGGEYTSANSFKLRHELRLLNEILYDYLVDKTFNNYIKKNKSTFYFWLARSFFDRKLNGVFEADIDRFIEFAKQHAMPEDGAHLLDLKSLWMIYTQQKTPGNVTGQVEAIEQWKQEHLRHIKYRLREMESRTAYLESTAMAFANSTSSSSEDRRTDRQNLVDLSAGAYDPYEEYLVLKKHSYQTSGLTRIEVLRKMLIYEEREEYQSQYSLLAPQISSLNSIAIEYILLGRFAEADKYLLDAIERSEKNKLPLLPATIQNYVANQVNLNTFKTGIDFYNRHQQSIIKDRQYVAIALYKTYCHLFLGQTDEALTSLPTKGELTDHQRLMQRMVYLIVFITRQQYELAVNECQNISRTLKTREGAHFENYSFINNLFSKYLGVVVLDRKARKAAIQTLKHELQVDADKIKKLMITEFALRWIVEEIEKG